MRRALAIVPLVAFLGVLALVGYSLFKPADRTVHSALVDEALPDVVLPALLPTKPGIANGYGGGRMRVINVFASWCVPCIEEAPQLLRLKAAGVPIDAIASRDTPDGVRAFLTRYGDPYARIGDDRDGKVQITLGSSGVPETFVVDGNGRIVRQYISNLQPDHVDEIIALWRRQR